MFPHFWLIKTEESGLFPEHDIYGESNCEQPESYPPACICTSMSFNSTAGCFVASRAAIYALQSVEQQE